MNKGDILVIDDEETICNLLRDCLSEEGYKVSVAQKAEDGLSQIKNSSFDLTLTDLKMPGMDGIELIRQMKELDPDNIVVVITAYPSFETVQDALRLGAYDYITKPLNLEEISFTVRRAVDFRRLKLVNKRLKEELEQKNMALEKKVAEGTKDLKKVITWFWQSKK